MEGKDRLRSRPFTEERLPAVAAIERIVDLVVPAPDQGSLCVAATLLSEGKRDRQSAGMVTLGSLMEVRED